MQFLITAAIFFSMFYKTLRGLPCILEFTILNTNNYSTTRSNALT